MGLLKIPMLTTPERAGYQSFRQRQRLQTEKYRPKTQEGSGEQSQSNNGHNFGFSLSDTIFDSDDDTFGSGA